MKGLLMDFPLGSTANAVMNVKLYTTGHGRALPKHQSGSSSKSPQFFRK